jgi:hypothetical protein
VTGRGHLQGQGAERLGQDDGLTAEPQPYLVAAGLEVVEGEAAVPGDMGMNMREQRLVAVADPLRGPPQHGGPVDERLPAGLHRQQRAAPPGATSLSRSAGVRVCQRRRVRIADLLEREGSLNFRWMSNGHRRRNGVRHSSQTRPGRT